MKIELGKSLKEIMLCKLDNDVYLLLKSTLLKNVKGIVYIQLKEVLFDRVAFSSTVTNIDDSLMAALSD